MIWASSRHRGCTKTPLVLHRFSFFSRFFAHCLSLQQPSLFPFPSSGGKEPNPMAATSAPKWFLPCVLLCATLSLTQCGDVTYDSKALIINGQRRILFSGSIHYPRSTPQVCTLCLSFFFPSFFHFFISL